MAAFIDLESGKYFSNISALGRERTEGYFQILNKLVLSANWS